MKPNPVVLIVDDLAQNRDLLEAYLAPKGYTVRMCSCGEDVMGFLEEEDVDLVLLDVMMPGMDGFEVTRRIRADERLRQLPIVLVTALKESQDRVTGIEAGCDDFISKPVDKIELMARVTSLLKVKAYNDLLRDYRKDLEAEVASRTEELAKALAKIKFASLETIYRLSVASEYKDEDTGAHVRRMSRYSAAVARQMGMDEAQVETILYSASMHDLGKIGIPDSILLKPAKLDAAEWDIMKQHTTIGAEILKESEASFIRLGETIARSHHEKWDGSGYPHQLKGTDIPLVGRVAAIADVFDALTSERPYKPPYSVEKSLEIIGEGRGTHFDPTVVDAFFAIEPEIRAIKAEFDAEIQAAAKLSAVP